MRETFEFAEQNRELQHLLPHAQQNTNLLRSFTEELTCFK